MKGDIDQETRDALLQTLANLRFEAKLMEQKKAEKLWKPLSKAPCSIKELLAGLTKDELTTIRQKLKLRGLSALKKDELADCLAAKIVNNAQEIFSLFDDSRYRLFKGIVDNNGVTDKFELDTHQIEYFRARGVVFSGTLSGKKVLTMPRELIPRFKDLDNEEYQKTVHRNTTWIRLIHGLVYYYGNLSFMQTKNMVAELTGEREIDYSGFAAVIHQAVDYYEEITVSFEGYAHYRVFDPVIVNEEHKKRPDLNYYPFTREQLFRAGKPGYVDKNSAFNCFTKFILENYRITPGDAEVIVEECVYAIKLGESPSQVVEFLRNSLEIESLEMAQALMEQINFLYNHTRHWFLKGYTPAELFQPEKKNLKSLPQRPLSKPKKVGRNESCPCGSGKKYKKCCGSNDGSGDNVIQFPKMNETVPYSLPDGKHPATGEDDAGPRRAAEKRGSRLATTGKDAEKTVFQLKINIKDIKPPIWRSILVPEDITFYKLHKIIQAAFGWQDYHLFDFHFGDTVVHIPSPEFTPEDLYGDVKALNARRTKICGLFLERGKCIYTYDFGDNWRHEIVLDRSVSAEEGQRYPVCLDGARHRPPEDVGGVGGYESFLGIIGDPQHPEYNDHLLWAEKDTGGRKFDPDYFYLNEINRALAKIK